MKRPTQSDVARLAGVSRATVSYVLNNRADGKIPITTQTRQRVLDAAEELGYVPSALARSLRYGSSRAIGFLMPAINNPHYWDILEGAEEEIASEGYHLVLVTAHLDEERERRCLQSLFQQRLDGLILATTYPSFSEPEVKTYTRRGAPIVFLVPQEGCDFVYADTRTGASDLMDHLISLGHRRIGFVHGVAQQDMARNRLQVYREKLAAMGIEPDECLVRHCGHLMRDSYRATRDLLSLDEPPTAIWTVNDLLAVGALRAISEHGLRVPQDISLAGFDDIALASELYPSLTTVRMDGYRLGQRAARLLFDRIGRPGWSGPCEGVPTKLVVRESTGAVRTG